MSNEPTTEIIEAEATPIQQDIQERGEIQPAPKAPAPVAIGPKGLAPKDMDGLWRVATAINASTLAPKGMNTAEDCFIAMAHGIEIGLPPMQSLQKIAVINGRPTVWGDAMLGLVLASTMLEDIAETFEGEPGTDEYTAICIVRRKGMTECRSEFSIRDAKRAGLWGKQGPWKNHYPRMLKMRARAFALRDRFADILGGLYMTEEIQGTEPPKEVSNTADAVKERIQSLNEEETPEPECDPDTGEPIPDYIGRGGEG